MSEKETKQYMLEVKNLKKYFPLDTNFFGKPSAYLKAVDDISFSLEKGKTIGQIILRWHYQLGVIAIPKAGSEEHQLENLAIFDFELSDEDMQKINALTQENGRIDNQDPREFEEF